MLKSDDQLRALALGTKKPAHIFRRLLSSPTTRSAPSYFGGLPILPPSTAWPRLSTGEHCSFIGQIDLGSLQASALLAPLPSQGSLLFFADTDTTRVAPESGLEGAVLFVPGTTAGLTEAVPPATLMTLYGSQGDPRWWFDDANGKSSLAGVFPRWPVEGVLVDTFQPYHPGSPTGLVNEADHDPDFFDEVDRYAAVTEAMQDQAWKRALGFAPSRAVADTLVSSFAKRGTDWPFHSPERGRAWMPDEAWPYVWINVRIAAAKLLEQCRRTKNDTAAIATVASEWLQKAPSGRAFEEVVAEEKDAIRSWLASLHVGSPPVIEGYKINNVIAESVVVGADFVFGYAPHLASRLPPALHRLVESRAAPCRTWGGETQLMQHQLLGHPSDVQGAPARMEPDHTLLMQFDSDDATFWMWGDAGVLQFWIRPEDLSARRFDRVVLTAEGF